MKTAEINTQSHPVFAPNKVAIKNDKESDAFTKIMERLEERVKEKIEKDLKNDETDNINMTDKKWHNLMNEVDNALSAFRENLKLQELNKQSSCSKSDQSTT